MVHKNRFPMNSAKSVSIELNKLCIFYSGIAEKQMNTHGKINLKPFFLLIRKQTEIYSCVDDVEKPSGKK